MQMEGSYTVSNGTRLYWDEKGAGEPLLLIMGLGYSLEMWFRPRPLLAQHFRTIAFDNRGVGKSDVPSGPYTMAAMAADAAAVLDAAGVDSAHVFGISMGGMIAQEFALNFPGRVKSLVLGCTSCGGRNAARAEDRVLQIIVARASMTLDDSARAMQPFVYDAGTPHERIAEDLEVRRRSYPTPVGYMGQLAAIFGWTSFDRSKEIRVPTLIVHGESDQLVPAENAHILQRQIPESRLVMLPRASHIFTSDQPEAAHRAILQFLAPGASPAPDQTG